jgi:hypothetical protein
MASLDTYATLPFDQFWKWLVAHPNCIVRAGTPDSVLYDDDDLHWHFATERPGELLIQLVRGKRLVAEMFIKASQVTFVQESVGDKEGEYLFEIVSESDKDRGASFHFVMAHRYEPEEASPRGVH